MYAYTKRDGGLRFCGLLYRGKPAPVVVPHRWLGEKGDQRLPWLGMVTIAPKKVVTLGMVYYLQYGDTLTINGSL